MSQPNVLYQHYQCDRDWVHKHPNSQCRGITTWNIDNSHTIPLLGPGESTTLTFTCTVPKCYSSGNTQDGKPVQGRDCCLVVFNAWAKNTNTSANGDDIKLKYTLNGSTLDIGSCISRVATHGGTQAFDLGPPSLHDIYNDMEPNSLVITNIDENNNPNSSTVQIDHFKIYRAYQMCNIIDVQHDSLCTYPGYCEPDSTAGTNGNLDSSRIDTPCNYSAGGGLSFSQCHNSTHAENTIPAGGSLSWTFNFNYNYANAGYTGNYQGESICLFNFNEIHPVNTSNSDDVKVDAYLNGHHINTYYLSKKEKRSMFPSHDLATSQYYNVTGPNTVILQNNGDVDIKMNDPGGIDIYRIFKTNTLLYTSPCDFVCQINQGCSGCQGPCQFGCYTCDVSCQETCETSCQECVTCQTGCETSCQDCYTCQTECQVNCQTSCQINCQYGCEVSCQDCYSCQGGCYSSCEVSCQTYCQDCQTGCQVNCQTECQVNCQTSCQINCQDCYNCQTECETCAVCYNDCYNACYEYNGRQDTNIPTTTENTITITQTTDNTQQNQTTQTTNQPQQTTNNNNPTTPINNNNSNAQTPKIAYNTPTITRNPQTPNNNTPTPRQNIQTPNNQPNNNINNNPKQNTQTTQTITARVPPNFNTQPNTNDDHIKEVLLEALIELGIITQPPKRKQMQ